jgi:hypothetical protein
VRITAGVRRQLLAVGIVVSSCRPFSAGFDSGNQRDFTCDDWGEST